MSHFYGTVDGCARSQVTRRGSRVSGLVTHAASWSGAVRTTLYVRDDVDYARVELVPWRGRGITRELYDGPINGGGRPFPTVGF